MPYTIRTLIEELEAAKEEYGEDCPVRIGLHQSYSPMQFELKCTCAIGDFSTGIVFYLATGEHPDGESPYAQRAIWDGEDLVTDDYGEQKVLGPEDNHGNETFAYPIDPEDWERMHS